MKLTTFSLLAAVCAAATMVAGTSQAAPIVLFDEDFSVDAGALTGGNGVAGFTAGGGVGSLAGNGTDTFTSIGVPNIMIPEFALGGELTFRVDNLGGAANDVTRWLQIDVDNGNPFSGDQFGPTNNAGILVHDDDGGAVGSQTIAAGTTELDLLFVTTVDFGGTPLPAGEVARLGSFYAEFTPAIPEPTTAALIGLGCVSVLGMRRRS